MIFQQMRDLLTKKKKKTQMRELIDLGYTLSGRFDPGVESGRHGTKIWDPQFFSGQTNWGTLEV